MTTEILNRKSHYILTQQTHKRRHSRGPLHVHVPVREWHFQFCTSLQQALARHVYMHMNATFGEEEAGCYKIFRMIR